MRETGARIKMTQYSRWFEGLELYTPEALREEAHQVLLPRPEVVILRRCIPSLHSRSSYLEKYRHGLEIRLSSITSFPR
jgi:hypothetical protein